MFKFGLKVGEEPRKLNINWIVDADVSGFFDNLDWGWLRAFIQQRVNDGGIRRLIGKWLHAGVLEAGELTHPDKGAPQGAVVSPMISNLFLHQVLDEWFVQAVQPRMKGRCFLTRFADDFIIGFELEADARRVMGGAAAAQNRRHMRAHLVQGAPARGLETVPWAGPRWRDAST